MTFNRYRHDDKSNKFLVPRDVKSDQFLKSEDMLKKALEIIPLGAQTFSKSHTQYPKGVSPYFASSGNKGRLLTVDGKVMIDLVCGLAAVTHGYCHENIDHAVIQQIHKGIVFSLSNTLEYEVASQICDMVPCAQMVRFAKNGSDATSGAIRLARAFTGRDIILMSGYHGWCDWSISQTSRNKGIPKEVQNLTQTFQYNDLEDLERVLQLANHEKVAAIILEPMNAIYPKDGYLQAIRDLCDKYGIILVFDETITGFRFAPGGAQETFGVIPDLVTLGKGIANGYPLSALAGRKDIMMEMNNIFFSSTMAGECGSLAAAKATLNEIKNGSLDHLNNNGYNLRNMIELDEYEKLKDVLHFSGHDSWRFLQFKNIEDVPALHIKTLFLQEMFAKNILTLGTHNVSTVHSFDDLDQIYMAYMHFFALLGEVVPYAEKYGNIDTYLRCKPLEPLFKVR